MIARTELLRTPHDAPANLLLMLTAYLDESGQESQDHAIVGGFIGNDDHWSKFSDEWRKALGARKSIHMSSLRWSGKYSERTRVLLNRLAPIPSSCGLTPVWSSVRVSDYFDLVGGSSFARKLGAGYMVAAQCTLLNILLSCALQNESVKVVFEQNDQFGFVAEIIAQVQARYAGLKIGNPSLPLLRGVEHVTKDSTSLTQPADCLVFTALHTLRDASSHKATWAAPIMRHALRFEVPREEIRKIFSSEAYLGIRETGIIMEPLLERARAATRAARSKHEKKK